MITLGQNNLVLVRSALKKGCADSAVLSDRMGFTGEVASDLYLIALIEPGRDRSYEMFHQLYDSGIITMYHHCVIVVDGEFWKWGVSWLGKKDFPTVYYRHPEIMACPIIWWMD